jgi:SAM-dependent methyltransferase
MLITRAPRRHLKTSELVDATRVCPICRRDGPRRAVLRLQSDPDVDMLFCPTCRACSASQMPRPEVLAGYYASYYDGSDREVTFSDPARFAGHIAKALPSDGFGPSLRLLDFGGGDGSLSRAVAQRLLGTARAARIEVAVVDFVRREAFANANLSIRFQAPDEPLGGPYDIVLASAILEHVPDLHRLLPELYAALSLGGFFYARTPYAIPLAKLVPHLEIGYPAHVHDLGRAFWQRAAETFSWRVRQLVSRPSPVAAIVRKEPLRAAAAYALKLPAYIANGRLWPFVGGWEVLLQRV